MSAKSQETLGLTRVGDQTKPSQDLDFPSPYITHIPTATKPLDAMTQETRKGLDGFISAHLLFAWGFGIVCLFSWLADRF